MSPASDTYRCDRVELVSAYALRALPDSDRAAMQEHIPACPDCRQELARLRPIVEAFASWADVLSPPASLWGRLAHRIAAETGAEPVLPATSEWTDPEWEEVAPGLSCKLLATDHENDRVSMLVRLAPGVDYPPHTHAGLEELHLLDGELWINDRKLYPGDCNRAEPGTSDRRVRSETGCTCVLITSPADMLR